MPYDTPVQNYYYFLFPHKEKRGARIHFIKLETN